MGEFLVFTIKSALLLTFLLAAYKVALGNSNRFGLRRMVLIAIYVLSVFIPLAEIIATHFANHTDAISNSPFAGNIHGMAMAIPKVGAVAADSDSNYGNIVNVIAIVMILGMAACVLKTLLGFLRIKRYRAKSRKEFIGEMPVAVIPGSKLTPFTFGGTIFLSEKEYCEKDPMVLAHEHCHSLRLHYLDLILGRLVGCLMWWNPFVWLMLREIHDVHEFQADEYVMSSGFDIRDYQLLLIRKAAGSRLHTFADSLNHSKLKKRLTMMKKSEKKGSLFRAALMIPALIAGGFVLSTDTVASILEPMRSADFCLETTRETETAESDGKISENYAQVQDIVIANQNDDADNSVKEEIAEEPKGMNLIAVLDKKIEKESKVEETVKKEPAIKIDGNLMSEDFDMYSINPSDIESIDVYKNHEEYPNGLILITTKKLELRGDTLHSDEPLKVLAYGSKKKDSNEGANPNGVIPNVYITTEVNNNNGTNVNLIIVPGDGEEMKIDKIQLFVNGKTYDADSVSSSFSKSNDMAEQKIEIKLNKTLKKFDTKNDKIIIQMASGSIEVIPLLQKV